MVCTVFWTCMAIPFLGSLFLTALLCSAIQTLSVLPISPAYVVEHSAQGIEYTTESKKISRACKPLRVQMVFTSRDTLRKSLRKSQWKEDQGWCTQSPLLIAQQIKDSRNAWNYLSCMSKILQIPTIGRKQNPWEGGQLGKKKGSWIVIKQRRPMMNLDAGLIFGSIVDPFVHPGSDSHMTRSATPGCLTVI